MITDNGLRLATAEVTPNQGQAPGGLGEASVNLALDASGVTTQGRAFADIGGGQRLALAFNVTTAFTCATFGATLELQLVSLPLLASLLTDGSGGASDGKLLSSVIPGTVATDLFTLAAHNLPVGTPVYITALSTVTGPALNTIYYVIPTGVDTFQIAASLADALAGTEVALGGTNGNVTFSFIPTIHASTGLLPLYNAGVPTNQGPLSVSGIRFQVPLRPLAVLTPQQGPLTIGGTATGQTIKQPLGAGPHVTATTALIAGNAQRYYYLRYVPSNTITAGAITCDLVVDAGHALPHYPSSMFEVKA